MDNKNTFRFKMKPQNLLIGSCICWLALLIQHSDGLFFTSGGAVVYSGTSAAAGANVALLGGLIGLKVLGIGVLALALVKNPIIVNSGTKY